jgi:hypothetical protein
VSPGRGGGRQRITLAATMSPERVARRDPARAAHEPNSAPSSAKTSVTAARAAPVSVAITALNRFGMDPQRLARRHTASRRA